MESLGHLHQYQYPVQYVSLHQLPPFAKTVSSVYFRRTSSKSIMSIRASSTPVSSKSQEHHYSRPLLETVKPIVSLLKTTCVVLAATALFFNRFSKPSFAAEVAQPTVESVEGTNETESDEDKERILEEYLESHPDDIKALRSLMEIKVFAGKLPEAISVVDRMIKIEPSEREWRLLKAHLLNHSGDVESAKLGFEEILSEDPFFGEAYYGLVMAVSQSEFGDLGDVLRRIENAMEKCKEEDLRDFKMLVAQVKFIEGSFSDALKIYQDLAKEDPRDFRPYLHQGIIYTLLQKKDEAEKQFQKYRGLVPKEHPYARSFDDNMLVNKVFSEMEETGEQVLPSRR
ncbi:hypothetical protein NE237_008710 [Protea cynaroides]|uniref:Uncharacterized protein n=1 Tax=Protea cynaroides TaxID=273540 RepID=A0A9Q0KWC2_9MAGN|nr:hypothetical protein NE237_008710 [Protea cynaroides]